MSDIWAIIPVKEFDGAKHRLSGLLSPPQRRLLAETMLSDVIEAVTGSRLLAGVTMVTLDPHATALGKKIGRPESDLDRYRPDLARFEKLKKACLH